jgi:hypothetical protein
MQQILKTLDKVQQSLYSLNPYFMPFVLRRDFTWGFLRLERTEIVFRTVANLPAVICGRGRPRWKSVSLRREKNSTRAGESCFD